ncbi:MAG: glutamate--tRNA ligase [Bacteroidales bacterium]|nr:glutamate--tRNA ligase [Bacteroidales bacterium]
MNDKPIRVRFAPSPTGPLHLGGVRTALYNYLFARKHNGTFILRIEDTDQNRFVPGAEAYILEALRWCGLEADEAVDKGGPHAPYRQSERSEIYRKYIQFLIERGHAYYAFDTPDALDALRDSYQKERGEQFQYSVKTRNQLSNSLTLPPVEVARKIELGEPYVMRILIPENQDVVFHDLIRGEVRVHTDHLDDKVLFKSDGLPTYHLANVVDDHLMQISHVIRGEEWLPSAPMHLLLYRFFGWEETMPQFAHLPLILKPDGHGKLSKRDGDRLGFPVFPLQWTDPSTGDVSRGYREDGYLPAAFINMLALLGWNPGTEQELFTIDELIHLFSLERIHKAGSKYDPDKAKWFNHQYVAALPNELLAEKLVQLAVGSWQLAANNIQSSSHPVIQSSSHPVIQSSSHPVIQPNHGTLTPSHDLADLDYATQVVSLIKDRITLIPDLLENARLFYFPPETYDPQAKEKMWKEDTPQIIAAFLSEVQQLESWTSEFIHQLVQNFTSHSGIKMGQLMMPLRLLIVGSNQGPGVMEIAGVIGKEDFLKRIETGLLTLG